jgi:hypothetical protein
MLDARALAVGLIRGRLRRRYPDLSSREINLKVLEEIERARVTPPSSAMTRLKSATSCPGARRWSASQ